MERQPRQNRGRLRVILGAFAGAVGDVFGPLRWLLILSAVAAVPLLAGAVGGAIRYVVPLIPDLPGSFAILNQAIDLLASPGAALLPAAELHRPALWRGVDGAAQQGRPGIETSRRHDALDAPLCLTNRLFTKGLAAMEDPKTKITPCLWFDNNLREALDFYAGIFSKMSVKDVSTLDGT